MDLPSIAKQAERPYVNLTVFFTALLTAGFAFPAIIPAGRLPNYLPGDIPSNLPADKDSEIDLNRLARELPESATLEG